MHRAQAVQDEARALREQQALEAALKLQALREKWTVDKAHTEVGLRIEHAIALLALPVLWPYPPNSCGTAQSC